MITVPEAARRTGRHPETVRRWIRSGRLPSEKVGTQHLVDERDLEAMDEDDQAEIPQGWRRMASGRPTPNVVAFLRESRRGR